MGLDQVDVVDTHPRERPLESCASLATATFRCLRREKYLGSVLGEHLAAKIKGPEDWVFEGDSGKPLDPHNLAQRKLYPVLARLGLPRFSWNRLRKLHSTYLLELGVTPRVLQAQLGHADAALTLNVYAQVLPDSQRRAVEDLEGLLFRNVPKPRLGWRVQ